MTVIKLAFEDLSEDLIDIVRITTINRVLERPLIILRLQVEWDLLDDLLLVANQVVADLLLVLVLGQLG